MMIESGLTAAFLIAGVSACRWRRGDSGKNVKLRRRCSTVSA